MTLGSADFQINPRSLTADYKSYLNSILGTSRASGLAPVNSMLNENAKFLPSGDYDAKRLSSPRQHVSQCAYFIAKAIEVITLDAAYTQRMKAKTGSIEVGKFADLVELGKDRASFSIYQTGSTKVLSTLLGGEFVRSINVSVKLWQVHYDPNRLF